MYFPGYDSLLQIQGSVEVIQLQVPIKYVHVIFRACSMVHFSLICSVHSQWVDFEHNSTGSYIVSLIQFICLSWYFQVHASALVYNVTHVISVYKCFMLICICVLCWCVPVFCAEIYLCFVLISSAYLTGVCWWNKGGDVYLCFMAMYTLVYFKGLCWWNRSTWWNVCTCVCCSYLPQCIWHLCFDGTDIIVIVPVFCVDTIYLCALDRCVLTGKMVLMPVLAVI